MTYVVLMSLRWGNIPGGQQLYIKKDGVGSIKLEINGDVI